MLEKIKASSVYLEDAMYVSFIQFLLPFDMFLRAFFFRKTGRQGEFLNSQTVLEVTLMISVGVWVY